MVQNRTNWVWALKNITNQGGWDFEKLLIFLICMHGLSWTPRSFPAFWFKSGFFFEMSHGNPSLLTDEQKKLEVFTIGYWFGSSQLYFDGPYGSSSTPPEPCCVLSLFKKTIVARSVKRTKTFFNDYIQRYIVTTEARCVTDYQLSILIQKLSTK